MSPVLDHVAARVLSLAIDELPDQLFRVGAAAHELVVRTSVSLVTGRAWRAVRAPVQRPVLRGRGGAACAWSTSTFVRRGV